MADFNIAIPKLLIKEGGARVTNDPNDNGGLTKYGISKRSFPNVDIVNLTEQQARDIYKREYWDKICGDQIESQMNAENIFESAVHSGVITTSRLVQHSLGVAEDGKIGPKTIAKLNAIDEKSFRVGFALALIARYASICNKDKSQRPYLLGWINRVLGAA